MDLVFSIRQKGLGHFTDPLVKFVVAIPRAKPPKMAGSVSESPVLSSRLDSGPDSEEGKENPDLPSFVPLLARDADPPMPTMLSNMRFNVIKHFGTLEEGFEDHLVLEVIPRSAAGCNVRLVSEASFLLSGAKIAWYEGTKPVKPWVQLL